MTVFRTVTLRFFRYFRGSERVKKLSFKNYLSRRTGYPSATFRQFSKTFRQLSWSYFVFRSLRSCRACWYNQGNQAMEITAQYLLPSVHL